MGIIDITFNISLLIHLIILIVIIYNYFTSPRITDLKETEDISPISILIPLRNEEENIEDLLRGLQNQHLGEHEILILDDNSTDNTFDIVDKSKRQNPQISLMRGEKLPPGWLGKNWACYQLSRIAKYDTLLFIDADVRLSKKAISSAVKKMKRYNVGMLSVFPTQINNSFGERLVVPLMNWLLLTFLPLRFVYKSDNISFAAANGQFILINKDLYNCIGTHSNFKDQVVEDMEMVRMAKRLKTKVMTCLGNNIIKAKMYSSFKDSYAGFSKNFFAGFNTSRLNFYLLLIFFILLFLFPFVMVFWSEKYIILIMIILFQRAIVSLVSKENILYNIILHPLQILIMFIIGLKSASRKKKEWKGRLI